MRDNLYQEKKIKFLISELQNSLSLISRENQNLENCENGEEEFFSKRIDNQYYRFNNSLKNLYIILIQYLENQGSNELKYILKSELSGIFDPNYNSVQSEYDDDWVEEMFWSEDLSKIKRILQPFEAFDSKSKKDIGIIYLENILLNTSSIIKDMNIVADSEAKVYNGVKHVITSTFPDYINITEPFYKEAKCYKPDILIPSLSTAVEYKFAQDEQRLIKTIEEILIDVAGYNGNVSYKNFYAVFYVKTGIWSEKRFQEVWKGYKFPENWKGIYVNG